MDVSDAVGAQEHQEVREASHPEDEDFGLGSKTVLYLLTLFVPIVGIVFGLIFTTNPKQEYKHVGGVMILLGVVPVLASVLIALRFLGVI
jgi:hypothetical protein